MNTKEIKELIELIQDSSIEEFEMERSGVRIRIRKSGGIVVTPVVAPAPTHHAAPLHAHPAASEHAKEEAEEELYIFKAPIVGTFYITPKPDAEPLIQEGDRIRKGTVLCIIEAMKIFNQIDSDVEGELIDILVENGQPVEYGEPLFRIRLS